VSASDRGNAADLSAEDRAALHRRLLEAIERARSDLAAVRRDFDLA